MNAWWHEVWVTLQAEFADVGDASQLTRITVRLNQTRNGTRNYTVVQPVGKNNPIYVGQQVRVIIGNTGSRVLAY